MGLSSSKTTTTSGPSKEALPFLTSASGALQGAYDANQGNLSDISAGLKGAFSHLLNTKNPAVSAASDYVTSTLGGEYQANPELQNQIDRTNSSVADRINALFSKSGQTGSSRQIGELASRLSENESNLRYTDWNNDQARRSAAVGQAIGLGGLDNQTAAAAAALGGQAASTPYLGAQILSSGLGDLWGNAQTQTQTQSGNLFQSLLQAGATVGAGFAASDPRLKTNIRKVGEFADGLGIYLWNYIWGGPQYRGVMATEVSKLRPWALGPKIAGEYLTVNYGAL